MINKLIKNINNFRSAFILVTFFLIVVIFFGCRYENYNLIKQIIYSIVFFLAFLIPGYTILNAKYFKEFKPIEKFVFSFGASFLIYATFALFSKVIFSENVHLVNVFFLLFLNFFGSYFIYKKKYLQKIETKEKKEIIWISAFFLLFIFFLQIFISLPFSMPDNLQDGPYVFKNGSNLHVKMQKLTGDLPADNFIPFVFSQFLLQEISFKKNRPMLPGQEVSNRTVLMGLNSTFFLSVFQMPEISKNNKLGKFSYVGTKWPDVGKLGNDNQSFSIFLTLGIIMNAVFLLAVYLLIALLFGKSKGLGIILILMIFPYTINQVIFTWPKFLMAYFLISATYLVIKKNNPYLIGLFLALAFHSHPSASIYIAFIVLYWLVKNFKITEKKTQIDFLKIVGIIIFMVTPWIIWTKFIVKIPSNLISQNAVADSYGLASLIKVRLDNLRLLFTLGEMPKVLSASSLFEKMTFTFAGAIGVYFLLSYFYMLRYMKKYYKEILILFLGPIVLLTMPWGKIFGCFSILFAQPSVPLFFAFAVMLFLKNRNISLILLFSQILISIYALWFGMYDIDLQITKIDIPNMLFGVAILSQIIFVVIGFISLFKKNYEENYKLY